MGITSGVGVIVKPRRRSRAEADTFLSIGRDFIVVPDDDGEGEWEMMEGLMPRVSCPDLFTCAEEDGSGGGVAVTEGARARREEKLVMAPVPPDGCREYVREVSQQESGEVDGDIEGGDDDGVDGPTIDPLLSAS